MFFVPDLDAESIAKAATGPSEAAADGQSAKIVPIPDQIEAKKFEGANACNDGGRPRGIKLVRCVPPGAAE